MARLATPWQASWTTKAARNPAAVTATDPNQTSVNKGTDPGRDPA